ncbi:MAG TPA: hypothetical protein VGA40_10095 [Candidatus Acidoferrales bacterium]
MTDHFPTFRRLARLNWRRILRWFAVLAVGVPLLAYAALRVNVEIAVWRAEQLLNEIRSLRLHESSFEDARPINDHFKGEPIPWNDKPQPCTLEDCSLWFSVGHMVDERIPKRVQEKLKKVGLRQWMAMATIRVQRGLVREISYGVVTDADEHFLTAGVQSVERFEPFRHSRPLMDEEPNYKARHTRHRGIFSTEFTADATPVEVQRAFDFRLGCLSRLRPCELQEMVPSAWEDYYGPGGLDLDWPPKIPCDRRTVARLARDATDIHLVRVVRVHPYRFGDDTGYRFVDYGLIRTIKGGLKRSLVKVYHRVVAGTHTADPDHAGLSKTLFRPNSRLLLFLPGDIVDESPDPDCGVIEATEENVAIVEQVLERERERNARTWPPKQ